MLIAGLQKTTLVDFPGKIAATVFTRGCNFRCGFCHNPEIVLPEHFVADPISEADFFRFLESRIGKLQGVCITGGEPLLWNDTDKFISHIKALGFAVKLDTNGSYPERLEKIIQDQDVDYIAMDIKSPFHNYEMVTNHKPQNQKLKAIGQNLKIDNLGIGNSLPRRGSELAEEKIAPKGSAPAEKLKIENLSAEGEKAILKLEDRIKRSINLIMSSNIDYEFRTTVNKPHHHPDDFIDIGKMIKGAKKYFIQNFVKSKHIDKEAAYEPFSAKDLDLALANIAPFVGRVSIR